MANPHLEAAREELDYILNWCDFNSDVDSRLQVIDSELDAALEWSPPEPEPEMDEDFE